MGEVIHYTAEKEKCPHAWKEKYESDITVQTAKKLLTEIKTLTTQYRSIEVEKPYLEEYERKFNDKFPKSPRSMRAFPQLLALIDMITLLNHKQRAQE